MDDVRVDLDAAYGRWERSDIETVVQMIAQAPAGHAGSSVAAALQPVFPEVGERFASASDAERSDYLRVLKGVCVAVLELWKTENTKPELTRALDIAGEVEADD